MQMGFTDAMLENPDAEDDAELSPEDRMADLRKRLAGLFMDLSPDDRMKVLDELLAQMNTATDNEKENEMTNTLGTDAKARADRISTDESFRRSVREAAETTNRRIAVDDRMAAEQRNQEGFASRYGANGTRIKVDHAGLQGIPERNK